MSAETDQSAQNRFVVDSRNISDKAAAQFAKVMFEWAPAEDIAAYDAGDMEEAARLALAVLGSYQADKPVISVDNNSILRRRGRPLTVVTLINRNMPFLLDSTMAEILERSGMIYMVVHPVLNIAFHSDNYEIYGEAVSDQTIAGTEQVSVIQLHLPQLDEAACAALEAALEQVLAQVYAAVSDWKPMLARLDEVIASYQIAANIADRQEGREAIALLKWLRDDNFTFLGMREFGYDAAKAVLVQAARPSLGILRDEDIRVLRQGQDNASITQELHGFLKGSEHLLITKGNSRSLVHRREYIDYIGIKLFDAQGQVSGELRLVGLFTSAAYTSFLSTIPYLRGKAEAVIARLGFNTADHSGKALVRVLEDYPRDDMFQIDVDALTNHAELIVALDERPRVRVLPRVDRFSRFVSVLVYLPRDRYDSGVREAISNYLMEVYHGESVEFHPVFLDKGVTRVQFIIRRHDGSVNEMAREALEKQIRTFVRTWEDGVRDAAEESAQTFAPRVISLAAGFPESYRETFSEAEALIDAVRIEALGPENPLFVDFYRYETQEPQAAFLKLYHFGEALALSQRVPLLENMGFRVISEQTFTLPVRGTAQTATNGKNMVHVHDMLIVSASGKPVDLSDGGDLLDDVFRTVWSGQADNDGYNGLAQSGRLNARQIMILRMYGRYLQQAGITYSQSFIAAALNRYPDIAARLYTLFDLRFNPAAAQQEETGAKEQAVIAAIEAALQDVPNIDDDQILRRYRNLIEATLRTNAYIHDSEGQVPVTLAVKLDPRAIDGLPEPRPYREIFVYGPEVEGVHLRFGAVARGGLRWSDRAQDYRTEVLGLVKAQQVKNAVIVPGGAKGGFYPKRLPSGGDRNAVFEAGRAAYITFISTMVSITDNIIDAKIVPPVDVIRRDRDDPYFVVAADKGTATFSDTANAISQAHNFWLDDAFASGGSAGYDHKKMGITARGAWEAVKRHFREMDIDIQTTPFTVAGVGDMSGDVFGNGMLLSPKIRLVAAFDHRDIFIDPMPDTEQGFAERQRLFNVPRSSWQDYDRSKISAGGGVFSRSQKVITLSEAAAGAIGLGKLTATPNEVISAILRAPVDLLWFGGIGTYIRASDESDAQAGDRANDAIRITGREVRAKVIGEGANLGVTQRGRIEYSLHGGRCNTDAIDNSAGVNSSDVEVNIKIAMTPGLQDGRLNRETRDVLLAQMTDEVAALVLHNNYEQSLALSLVERRGASELPYLMRMMSGLERRKLLDRKVEFLPDDQVLADRQQRGEALTRPELAVLLAYAKMALSDDLIAGNLPDDTYLHSRLFGYFPQEMQERFARDITHHRLHREIIATLLANDAVNRCGPAFVSRLNDLTAAAPAEILRAYVAVADGFETDALYQAINALDNKIPGKVQNEFYALIGDMLFSTTAWVLRNNRFDATLSEMVNAVKQTRMALEPKLEELMPDFIADLIAADTAKYLAKGAGEALARKLARLQSARLMADIALIAYQAGAQLLTAATAYFKIVDTFRIANIEKAALAVPVTDYYDGLALSRATDTITQATRAVTLEALGKFKGEADPVQSWLARDAERIETVRQRMIALTEGGDLSVSRLAVAAGFMADLAS
ncbi:NAD-glutamate dehydrogenase [Pseudochrobactrum sp. HB0163]|uniref:NAD-glutamate dehydrogenase n=1 Tax=Pseudochrobactrum sp. HB0163 TaxID=3450708 RepID=UPI003F6E328D